MNQQDHTHGPEPDRPGGHRTRSPRRWWAVGLAGVTGLALTTVGIAATPAADAIGRALTTDNRTDTPHQPNADNRDKHGDSQGNHDDKGKGNGKSEGNGKGKKEKKPPGTPVPCDTDALIAAITLANARGGATLNLASKCTYLLTADIAGAGLPAITTPITLNGHTHTTIERAAAVDEFRILTVNTGGDLTLNKLKITGGQTTDNGGGILVDPGGTLTTNHSTITRNIADGAGGGIANNGTTTVKHSTVSRNTAGTSGGGIVNANGLLTVTTSQVKANTADIAGGIASLGSAGTVHMTKSVIADNQAQNAAGGLLISQGVNTISDTTITGNTALQYGGLLVSGQLTLRKVEITKNTASAGIGGGLVTDSGATVVIEKSLIKGNAAAMNSGGGIYNTGQLVLRDSKVVDNQATLGGGIYNIDGVTTLFNTQVVKNLATTDGGGIFNDNGTVNLNTATGTVVIKNRPNNCVDVPGCPA
ncbi:right-handed parallel beta-helix repeat-containing protein [Salinispora mooreana]|uniref:right-handed parallel beta-helix repeat-containing protein n=1 Tax=Salinispora mooreana TaxID=999545 RepID=UPI00036D27C8|nr:right-handed parallel beta-helix repeat-containing protein [Salinispora mooreana]